MPKIKNKIKKGEEKTPVGGARRAASVGKGAIDYGGILCEDAHNGCRWLFIIIATTALASIKNHSCNLIGSEFVTVMLRGLMMNGYAHQSLQIHPLAILLRISSYHINPIILRGFVSSNTR